MCSGLRASSRSMMATCNPARQLRTNPLPSRLNAQRRETRHQQEENHHSAVVPGVVSSGDPGIFISLQQKLDALTDAEMMPVGQIFNVSAVKGDPLQGRNQRKGLADQLKRIQIRLTLAVS